MARLNPLSLTRLSPRRETKEFTDAAQPDATLTITLQANPDAATRQRHKVLCGSLVTRYITGDADWIKSNGESGTKPIGTPLQIGGGANTEGASDVAATLNLPDGDQVVITGQLCLIVAILMDMQEAAAQAVHGDKIPLDDRPYTPIEWFVLSARMPNAFEAIVEWAQDMFESAEGRTKNLLAAAQQQQQDPNTDTSCASPSGADSDTIPS